MWFKKNTALFYNGIEKEIKNKYFDLIQELKSALWIKFGFEDKSVIKDIIKIRIPKDNDSKSNRLLCILFKIKPDLISINFQNEINNIDEFMYFFVYPIDYDNFHNNS